MTARTSVLDKGYVEWIESWGSDQRIIEAARMSTDKGFLGWDAGRCPVCDGHGLMIPPPIGFPADLTPKLCYACDGNGKIAGDRKLLKFLYSNHHDTPFEMAGMVIEVKAPIMVFREWHRHRTQSYNEMSARYIPLPDENYMPDLENVLNRSREAAEATNKQARGATVRVPTHAEIFDWLDSLGIYYGDGQVLYERGLEIGIPKEIARLPVPVGRYSKMRASANLRNWLAFLTLRNHPKAQWEIRQFARVVADLVAINFPETAKLFVEIPR